MGAMKDVAATERWTFIHAVSTCVIVIGCLLLCAGCASKAHSPAASNQPIAPTKAAATAAKGSAPPTPQANKIPEPPETGPGWRDGEYLNAMATDNRRGRDVHRPT